MVEKISKNELKKISKEFRHIASRLLQTTHENADKDVKRFIHYIENTYFILDYIKSCCKEKYNFEEINDLQKAMPIEKEAEISYIYQFLKYIIKNSIPYHRCALGLYTGKLQTSIDKFGNTFIQPFTNHIAGYISDIFDELGYNDVMPNKEINIQNANQVNVAQDEAIIHASNVNNSNIKELIPLIDSFLKFIKEESIPNEQEEEITALVETVKEQTQKERPKKGLLKVVAEKMSNLYQVVDKSGKLAGIIFNIIAFLQHIL